MSLTSPPGQGKRLTQLLAFIVDDDDRTRRANLLLRTVSTCLLTAGGHSGRSDARWRLALAGIRLAASGAVPLLLRRARARRQRSGR